MVSRMKCIKFSELLMLLLLLMLLPGSKSIQGTILQSPRSFVFLPGITHLPIQLTCDITPSIAWLVNSHPILFFQLASNGYDINGYDNILIDNPKSNSEFICTSGRKFGKPYHIFVAGVPEIVPDVKVDQGTIINVDDKNVTLILNWGEPFNNLDPILSYTVSCSGDVSCPPVFTTTDTTTRKHTITNLIAGTKYTFSVVATNSIGKGKAGIQTYTTAGKRRRDIKHF